MSKLPLNIVSPNNEECDIFFINMITTNIQSAGNLDISNEVKKKNKLLRDVFIRVFKKKWPSKIKDVPDDLKLFYHWRQEFSIKQGYLMWGHRLVSLPKFRKQLLLELHSTHMGSMKMKICARS